MVRRASTEVPRSFPSSLVTLELKTTSRIPIYQQLFAQLRSMILSGDLAARTRLPATRELARAIGCSRSTVLLAFETLAAEGYVESRQGSGTYVVDTLPDEVLGRGSWEPQQPLANAPARLSPMATRLNDLGIPGSLIPHSRVIFPDVREFPYEIWTRLFRAAWREPARDMLGPYEALGYLPLRREIARYLRDVRGLRCEAEQVAITSGTSHGLQLLCQLLFGPGDRVCVEDPAPPWVKAKIVACGAEPVFVPVDKEGFCTEVAKAAGNDVRGAIVTPSHQFPLGHVLSPRRRAALLDWAEANDGWIIEDDFDSEFRYAGRPLPPLYTLDRRSRVFYLATFSKMTLPGLRLGYIVLPPQFVPAFERLRALADRYTAVQLQPVLAKFMEEGHFASHVRRMRALYESRQEAFLALSQRFLSGLLRFDPKDGGIHSIGWLEEALAARMNAAEIASLTSDQDVQFSALSAYCEHGSLPEAVLIGYARHTEGELTHGLRRVSERLKQRLG